MTARTYFKTAAHEKRITSTDIATLCLIKALAAKSDDKVGVATALLKRSFNPITKPSKLLGGFERYGALNTALFNVRAFTTFATFLNDEEKEAVVSLAKEVGRF